MSKLLVCFIGTDGSGKSTLANNIFRFLTNRKIKVRKVYGRYQPLFTRYLMWIGRKIFLKNFDRISDYDKYIGNKRAILKRASILARMYISMILIEYYLEMLFKLIIPYRIGYSIVSDRYVYDTVINDVAIDLGLSTEEVNRVIERFWMWIPKPDLVFLVQVPEEVALKRKPDIPSASYLRIRNDFYEKIAVDKQTTVLDGTIDISQLEKYVMHQLEEVL